MDRLYADPLTAALMYKYYENVTLRGYMEIAIIVVGILLILTTAVALFLMRRGRALGYVKIVLSIVLATTTISTGYGVWRLYTYTIPVNKYINAYIDLTSRELLRLGNSVKASEKAVADMIKSMSAYMETGGGKSP